MAMYEQQTGADKKDLSLNMKLDKVLEALESKNTKDFKMPLWVRIQKGKFRKNNAVVMFIKTNGSVDIKVLPIEDNAIKIGDVYHDASADYILRYKKYPLLIIPEWNIEPVNTDNAQINEQGAFSTKKNFKEASEEGKLTSAEKVIITSVKLEAIKSKFNLNFKTILIILAVIGGGGYLLHYFGVF